MEFTYFDEMYLQYVFANSAAPVVANRKPSALMTIWKHHLRELNLRNSVIENRIGQFTDCQCEILLETSLYYLVFCYQKEKLEQELDKVKNSDILYDYRQLNGLQEQIQHLKKKILLYHKIDNEFPHEVGLFLGYPIWDVEGFIKHKGLNYKLCGYWKVYDDIPGALCKFEEFDRLRMEAIGNFQRTCDRNNRKMNEKRYSV